MSHKCPECPKRFKSKSGRRRHIKAQHPSEQPALYPTDEAAPQEQPVTDDQDAAPPELDFADVQLPHGDGKDDAAALKAALKALAIKRANVMAYRVYPDKVVLIEGPVGWKRVWRPEEE